MARRIETGMSAPALPGADQGGREAMTTVRPGDRAAVEGFYTIDDFQEDANLNADPQASVRRGVSVMPDPKGEAVVLARASRHVGEDRPELDTAFLAPFRDEGGGMAPDEGGFGAGVRLPRPAADPAREYADFIDRLAAAAQACRPDGTEPDRAVMERETLKGFRGG
jgi:hypothetical protein